MRSASAETPLTASELKELQSTLTQRIPDSLADFLCTESASCNCKYYVTVKHADPSFFDSYIYGGASLCQSEHFTNWNSEPVFSVFDDIDPYCAQLWRGSFLFQAMDNGDFLGLQISVDPINPPVLYLAHDAACEDETFPPIAPSLDHFLREWEKISYIGPEEWMLEGFIDPRTGYINAGVGDLNQLQANFT